MKLLFSLLYKTLAYSCVYKTLSKEWGQAKSTWNLFQSRSKSGKENIPVTVCHTCQWIERHPCSCTVRTILSVTIWANSWSCHRCSHHSLRGFHGIQLNGHFALAALFPFFFFLTVRRLQASFHIFFLYFTFYSIDFIRNGNFCDH